MFYTDFKVYYGMKVMPYCRHCGEELKENAKYCPNCPSGTKIHFGKSHTVSILLAIFLGYWTWLYTYKKDAGKFWVGLSISLVIVIFAIIRWSISGWYIPIFFVIWVSAIVNKVFKKSKWYRDY